MDRREAMKAFGALVASANVTVAPLVTHEGGTDIVFVVLRIPGDITQAMADLISEQWRRCTAETPLQGVKAVVLPNGIDIEIVRGKT